MKKIHYLKLRKRNTYNYQNKNKNNKQLLRKHKLNCKNFLIFHNFNKYLKIIRLSIEYCQQRKLKNRHCRVINKIKLKIKMSNNRRVLILVKIA